MGLLQLVSAIGFPALMAVGGIAAWRLSKRQSTPAADQPAWRDDSLEEWRRQRDEQAAVERDERAGEAGSATHEGTGGDDGDTKRIQRIGG